MTLPPGARLGPYEIVAPLGAGGMGQVYTARDSRIGRTVAIKVLPAEVEQDADRRRRFHQEAVAAGALNHPNVLIVHDVGVEGGRPYLVTELLAGRSLRDVVARGALPAAVAVRYAAALLDGLAAAHAAGIVHRDVKPENIFITGDDVPKLLDFGLARLDRPVGGAAGNGATATAPGMVMGTVGYMAPEQIAGEPVDHRADLFAIGVVLYEMLTGRAPFAGTSPIGTLNAIVTADPVFPEGIGGPLRAVLEHALQKTPARRFQSAADFAFALRLPLGGLAPRPRRLRLATLLVAAAVVGALAAAGVMWRATPSPTAAAHQQRLTFQSGRVWSARFLPGNDTVLYAASWNEQPIRLFSTRMGFPSPARLDLPPADLLSVSRSGELALLLGPRSLQGMEPSAGTLATAPMAGGAPRELVERALSADWMPDGNALVQVRDMGAVRRLEFPAGTPVYETAGWIDWVRVSRDGAHVAFADHPIRADDLGDLVVADRARHIVRLGRGFNAVRGLAWAPGDAEVWLSRDGRIDGFALGGSQRVVYRDPRDFKLLDVDADGRMLIVDDQRRAALSGRLAGDTTERDLTWFEYSVARDISRDGRAVLFFEAGEVAGNDYLVGLWRAGQAAPLRLGSGRPTSLSADGRLALAIKMRGAAGLRVLPTGPGDTREIDFPVLASINWATWLPDGQTFVLSANEAGHSSRLYVADLSARLIRTIGPEGTLYQANAVSPDGTRLAAQDPRGVLTVYGVSDGTAVAVRGVLRDELPLGWSGDGTELYVAAPGIPAHVSRVNPATGARRPWRDLMPSDPSGVVRISPILIAGDGESYAYTSGRFLSTLYAISAPR